MKKWLIRSSTNAALRLLAFLARRPRLAFASDFVTRALARLTVKAAAIGTGDLEACHRMMEFDREVMRLAGGRFVVLESQATPGVAFCRVAMRRKGESLSGLVPAHERTSA